MVRLQAVPIGLEKLLCRAAADGRFREALRADRAAALAAAGLRLSEAEAAVLASVPAAALDAMVDRIDPRRHATGPLMKGALAAAFAGVALAAPGCRSPEPPPPPAVQAPPPAEPQPAPPEPDVLKIPVESLPTRGIVPR